MVFTHLVFTPDSQALTVWMMNMCHLRSLILFRHFHRVLSLHFCEVTEEQSIILKSLQHCQALCFWSLSSCKMIFFSTAWGGLLLREGFQRHLWSWFCSLFNQSWPVSQSLHPHGFMLPPYFTKKMVWTASWVVPRFYHSLQFRPQTPVLVWSTALVFF